VRYYRRAADALTHALDVRDHIVLRFIEHAEPGTIYQQLCNAPYRGAKHLVDAHDRKAAIAELAKLRSEIIQIGTHQNGWSGRYPGSGIADDYLRERVFAVLFTALQSQYANFGRLLLVIDIVLADLLIGGEPPVEVSLHQLVEEFGYPNPQDLRIRQAFNNGD
jgi:hypothetical protein